MQGTIQEMGQSKAGNPKVKINGTWYSIKSAFGLGVGSVLDFEAQPFTINGRTYQGIEKFAALPIQAAPAPQTASAPWPASTAPIGASPSIPAPSGYTEPERLWLSNVVAAAITAGKIVDPCDLPAWVNAALYSLRNAKADLGSTPVDF